MRKLPRSGDSEVRVKAVALITRELLVLTITFEDEIVKTLDLDGFDERLALAFGLNSLKENPELLSQGHLARSAAYNAGNNQQMFNKLVRKYIVEADEMPTLRAKYAAFTAINVDAHKNKKPRKSKKTRAAPTCEPWEDNAATSTFEDVAAMSAIEDFAAAIEDFAAMLAIEDYVAMSAIEDFAAMSAYEYQTCAAECGYPSMADASSNYHLLQIDGVAFILPQT